VKKTDRIGVFAVVWIVAFLAVTYVAVSSAVEQRSQERALYSECVRNIPMYLDAQEILYQEQECRGGIRSANP
jgi:hypothetical protein